MKMFATRMSRVFPLVCWCFLAAAADATPLISAGSGLWTNQTTWSPAQVPTLADSVTIANGHTVTVRDVVSHELASLTIQTNAVLTHQTNGLTAAGEPFKVILRVASNLTIDAGGAINADGKGYQSGNGPGAPGGSAGAAHGGRGIRSALGNPPYGSIIAPTNLGSGGNNAPSYGGGAVIVVVDGTATVNGVISCGGKGATNGALPYDSASGGSVFLTAGAMGGTGVIRVNGDSAAKGPGGGGRIALILTNSIDFGSVKCEAYPGTSPSAEGQATCGTIYREHTGHQSGQGQLILDGFGQIPTPLPWLCNTLQNGKAASYYAFSEIILTNGALYGLDTNDVLNLTNTVIRGDPTNFTEGIWLMGGTLGMPDPFVYSNIFIGLATNGPFNPGASLTVGTNAGLSLNVPFTFAFPVIVKAGGSIFHGQNTTLEVNKLNLTILGDLIIEPGGMVNVDGLGYQHGNGLGYSGGVAAGAAYGGRGMRTALGLGTTYGSIIAPTNLGSGGNYVGQYGGGAALLTVQGTTVVNGIISASGRGATLNPNPFYSGSGGSVFLTTAYLAGSGTIRANGDYGSQGSGGGGRVAVILTNSTDFGSVVFEAYAGSNAVASGQAAGGTVYLQQLGQGSGQGKLIVNYNDRRPEYPWLCNTLQNGKEASSYPFSEIILTNGGVYALDTNDTLDISSGQLKVDPSDGYDGIWVNGGTLLVEPGLTLTNYYIGIGATGSVFNPSPLLTVVTTGVFSVNAPFTLPCPLLVGSGGVVDHSPNASATNEAWKLDLTVQGDLTVTPNGQVTADGRGWAGNSGPGRPYSVNCGGSHGGMGGGKASSDVARVTYGSITAPTNFGSGGSYAVATTLGGGAIRLVVEGQALVNGRISANAALDLYSGAGGSVYLTAGSLTGTGMIRANSPLSPSTGWSLGGGGRVAVILTNGIDFGSVKIQALGSDNGQGSVYLGGAGTVYLQTAAQSNGMGALLIDGSNLTRAVSTLLSSNMSPVSVGSVQLMNKAVLELGTNQSITVYGGWSNGATFLARTNSTVFWTSTNEAAVYGTNAFFNLICTSAVKTVRFAPGSTNTVAGQLALGGGATFRSLADGEAWFLALASGGTQQIGVVKVRDSYANGGQPLIAPKGSENLGNTVNWVFFRNNGILLIMR